MRKIMGRLTLTVNEEKPRIGKVIARRYVAFHITPNSLHERQRCSFTSYMTIDPNADGSGVSSVFLNHGSGQCAPAFFRSAIISFRSPRSAAANGVVPCAGALRSTPAPAIKRSTAKASPRRIAETN